MKQVNIVIQNAHRNASNGQTGTAGEMDLVDKVFYALSLLLVKAGIVVYYDDANLINTKNLGDTLNYFVALHFDGSTNPTYNGGFIDDCPACPNGGVTPCDNQSVASWKFAQTVSDYYFGPMGIAFTNHSTNDSKYYYAFNYTGANTKQFLIELGTLTNPTDRAILQDYGKIATLLAKGIIQYLTSNDTTYQAWLKGNTGTTPVPPTVPDTAQIDELRKQLQAQTDLVTSLTKDKEALSRQITTLLKDKKAQTSQINALNDRLNKIKTFV